MFLRFKKIYRVSDVSVKYGFMVINIDGPPDYKRPYYSDSNEVFQAYSFDNTSFNLNSNLLSSFDSTIKIFMQIGSIRMALDGASFYNQYDIRMK